MPTVVSIANGGFSINDTPTYSGRSWKGHRIEGRLFNSRMANAIADDENPSTRGAWDYADGPWDAERSTREFIAALAKLGSPKLTPKQQGVFDRLCLTHLDGREGIVK